MEPSAKPLPQPPRRAAPVEPTSRELLRRLLDGPATAAALAAALRVDVAAARRHLEEHAARGRVASMFRHEGVGRPRKYYEITDAGRETLARRYDVLAQLLLDALDAEDVQTAERVVERVAQALAREVAPSIPAGGDLRARAHALVDALRALGFPTELETRADRLVLRRTDCIFLRAAQKSPTLVCRALDTRLLALALGHDVHLRACLPEGAPCCLHDVPLPASPSPP